MQPSPAATTFTLFLSFFLLYASPPPSLRQCSPSTPKRLRLREGDTLQRGRRTRMPRLVSLPECADDMTEGGEGEAPRAEQPGQSGDTGEMKDERVMLAEKYEALECIFDCALPPKMCGHACARCSTDYSLFHLHPNMWSPQGKIISVTLLARSLTCARLLCFFMFKTSAMAAHVLPLRWSASLPQKGGWARTPQRHIPSQKYLQHAGALLRTTQFRATRAACPRV